MIANNTASQVAGSLQGLGGFGTTVNYAIGFLVFGVMALVLIMIFDYMVGWVERKTFAKIHLRHGPTYVGKYGLLQNLADFLKLFSKEMIVPANANKYLFILSLPIVAAIFLFLILMIPFSPNFFGINASLGLLIVFVFISFVPILIFIAGWSSGNKFSSIAAIRSVILLISYELPLFLVVVSVGVAARGFDFLTIVNAQSNLPFAILMPVGFVVFGIAMLAELERPPFDLREADSELIAGWLVEVSAPFYGMALFVDYTRMFLGSMLVTVLFLGGWLGPAFLPPLFWLFLKMAIVVIVVILIRATTPRMRLDKILRLGWAYLIPLTFINLIWAYLLVANIL